MANRNNPNGFIFDTYINGGPPRTRPFTKLAAVATAIFQNDVVHAVAGAAGAGGASPLEPFGTATPGTTLPSGVAINFGAALTLSVHHVITDPLAEFHAQDNASTDGINAADVGQNANVVATAGSTVTGYSKHQINEATIAVTGTLDVHLLRLYSAPDNAFGANARCVVKFNKHREATASVGV